jgi:hypothetical protein
MMSSPLVSVVIPSYNQAEFLADAVQSVLNQTYQNFEIIVVNDASPDDTGQVMKQFNDARIQYIVHERNLRLAATRNTGMRASRGDIIALLDADDLFHPEKLQSHVDFLQKHPEVGVTYNSRFELNHSSRTIRELWRPPMSVGLVDLMLGFPFSPSDTVIRRDWAFQVGLFNPEMGTAEDTDFPCRLALAGCKFAGINRALNYRSYHSGRGRKNLEARLHDVERVLEAVLADPRCPAEARAIGRQAIKHHMLVIVSLALIQEETEIAQKYIHELVQLDPSIMNGTPCELVQFLLSESVADEGVDHELLLKRIFSQLPQEYSWISSQYDWAVARGYLRKGIRAIIWNRMEAGRAHIARAAELNAQMDEPLMQRITYQLMGHENEFGAEAVDKVLANLSPSLNRLAQRGGDRLEGSYWVNRAFEDYRAGEYEQVPGKVLRAWMNDLSYLTNRGVLSIFLRSLVKTAV